MNKNYSSDSHKVLDFLLGLFGNVGIIIVSILFIFPSGNIFIFIAFFTLEILFINDLFKRRRFLAIGAIAAIMIPLVLFGFCTFTFIKLGSMYS